MTESHEAKVLAEAQRTTHAVRAIARFIILLVTYTLGGGLLLFSGFIVLDVTGESALSVGLVLGGAALVIGGLVHSLRAGWAELGRSNRFAPQVAPATTTPKIEEPKKSVPFELVPGKCECTKFERGLENTGTHDGVKYCQRCEKAVEA